MSRDRVQFFPLLRVAAFFVVGIVVGDSLQVCLPTLWMALACLMVLGAAIWLSRMYYSSVLLLASSLFLGIGLVQQCKSTLTPVWGGERVVYDAVVVSRPVRTGKVARLDLLIIRGKETEKVRAFIRCDANPRCLKLKVGDGIHAASVFRCPGNERRNPHFDYARWLTFHGYAAITWIDDVDWQPALVDVSHIGRMERAQWKLTRFRDYLVDCIQHDSGSAEEEAIIAAMALGDKSSLSRDVKDAYSITGSSHILALSGLHLGIIYGLLILLLPLGRRWIWLSQLLSLAAIWAYALMVGMMPSVVRSAVMLTVYGLLSLASRRHVSANALALTAILMLVVNPLLLWDVGFQMSFMAVLSICFCFAPIHGMFHPSQKVVKWLWSMVVVSFVAQLGTAPLVMYYFGRFSCYFLPVNFLVIPLATLILYGVVCLLVLSWWPWACNLIVKLLHMLSWMMNKGVMAISTLPGASIENIHISVIQVVLIYVAMGCLLGAFCQWRLLWPNRVKVAKH